MQECNWSFEPYTADSFMRSAGGEWGWCYLDHEAFRWHDVAIAHDPSTDTIAALEGGAPRAHLDRGEQQFRLQERGPGRSVPAPQELRSPRT